MRQVALVLLGGVFLMLLWRHVRGIRNFSLALTILGVMFCGLGYIEAKWLLAERAYTSAARELTGRDDVKVHCQRTFGYLVDVSGYMGYVPYKNGTGLPDDAYLRNDTCKAIASFRDSPEDGATAEEIRAIHVLTHEAMHLMNERDEAAAECQAMQRDAETARLLGASETKALLIARAYYLSWYPTVPAAYSNPEACRRGGEWDEGRADAPWNVQVG